jgi:hypothetical protein
MRTTGLDLRLGPCSAVDGVSFSYGRRGIQHFRGEGFERVSSGHGVGVMEAVKVGGGRATPVGVCKLSPSNRICRPNQKIEAQN